MLRDILTLVQARNVACRSAVVFCVSHEGSKKHYFFAQNTFRKRVKASEMSNPDFRNTTQSTPDVGELQRLVSEHWSCLFGLSFLFEVKLHLDCSDTRQKFVVQKVTKQAVADTLESRRAFTLSPSSYLIYEIIGICVFIICEIPHLNLARIWSQSASPTEIFHFHTLQLTH